MEDLAYIQYMQQESEQREQEIEEHLCTRMHGREE